jgi:hypothetical protein
MQDEELVVAIGPRFASERDGFSHENVTHPQSKPSPVPQFQDDIVNIPRKNLLLSSETGSPPDITSEGIDFVAEEKIPHLQSKPSPLEFVDVPQIQETKVVQLQRKKVKVALPSKVLKPSSCTNVFAQDDITRSQSKTSPVKVLGAPQIQLNGNFQVPRKKLKSALSSKASRYPNLTSERNALEQEDAPRPNIVIRTIFIPVCVPVDLVKVKGTQPKHLTKECQYRYTNVYMYIPYTHVSHWQFSRTSSVWYNFP